MGSSASQRKAQAVWDRIEAIGGHGVWDGEMCIVCLANTNVSDNDLSLFDDFPYVEVLDLSHTVVGDTGLAKLKGLPALEELILIDTKIGMQAIRSFRADHPEVEVTTQPPPAGTLNPFTGEPF